MHHDAFAVRGLSGSLEALNAPADSAPGIYRIERQVFDPNAEVILAVGADLRPGQAGFDDNFNGVVDDQGEMGAVGSDDVCLAPWNEGYQEWANTEGSVVISRGAFVPVEQDDKVESNLETRFLLYGRSGENGERAWTRLVLPQ